MFKHYLDRLYAFQLLKLKLKAARTEPRLVPEDAHRLDNGAYVDQIVQLLNVVHRAWDQNKDIVEALNSRFGYSVRKGPSSLPAAGTGVFLKGSCSPGQVLCLYPGTVYQPYEPLLFVSIANRYILKCIDGIYIDGKPKGLSRSVHRSLYRRDNWPGAIQTSDSSWMTDNLRNPLAIGQFVNNGTRLHPANVRYQEVDLPPTFPTELRQYIPNIYWSTVDPFTEPTRVVALVSTRPIKDEELLSTYMEAVPATKTN